jgi:hypothetical protein
VLPNLPSGALANQAHKVYPYLLRVLAIDRPPNHVCATVTTNIPMARGFFIWWTAAYRKERGNVAEAYESIGHACESVGRYFAFYNSKHSI